MLTIDSILREAARDLKVAPLSFAELRDRRDACYDDALSGRGSSSISAGELRYLELCCKAYGDSSVPPPASSVPKFLDRQYSGSTIHASQVQVERIRRIARLIIPRSVDPNDLLAGMKNGPGATADGLISIDKWLAITNGQDAFSEHIDPLNRLRRIQGSRVCKYYDVPKTAWTMRGICAEPVWLQFVQQGIGHFINRKLEGFYSPVTGQTENQHFACESDTETIDLSAASDYITVELCDLLFSYTRHDEVRYGPHQTSFHTLISQYRSDWACMPDKSLIALASLTNMGNGYCFQLLTLVCILICLYAYEETYGVRLTSHASAKTAFRSCFRVFGDDIVVKTDVCLQTRYAFELFGLRVNPAKSSYRGFLKETCGLFLLNGKPVNRILRMRDLTISSQSVSSLCLAQRRAYRAFMPNTARLIAESLRSSSLSRFLSYTCETADYGDTLVLNAGTKPLERYWDRRRFDAYYRVFAPQVQNRDVHIGDDVGSSLLWVNPCSHVTCERVGSRVDISLTKIYAGTQRADW